MSDMIEIQQVSKAYGARMAVENLSLTAPAGAIFGFVGPNGAGKSTTIRMMCTLMPPDRGDIVIGGHSVRREPQQVRRLIGYMPDFFGLYPDMLVWEYLDFFAGCYDIPPAQRPGLIHDVLELVELSPRRADFVEKLSTGMKQRLSLARTLLHEPQVLVLDEPAAGLDPAARVEIRQLLVELARMGKTIFFSTHILADVAEICSHVGILQHGKLAASGRLHELRRWLLPGRRLKLRLPGGAPDPAAQIEQAQQALRQLSGNEAEVEESQDGQGPTLSLPFNGGDHAGHTEQDQALSALLNGLVNAGVALTEFRLEEGGMEEVFLAATGGGFNPSGPGSGPNAPHLNSAAPTSGPAEEAA